MNFDFFSSGSNPRVRIKDHYPASPSPSPDLVEFRNLNPDSPGFNTESGLKMFIQRVRIRVEPSPEP